ncbi:unnamed protein product [Rotaria socialis]|uniref:Cation efflux protein cytoplasmic domain-containing protein n=1 Tax=Rotaria socialis TaxID=392032 RepID=A0A817QA40_9BILA|nr:unnamed protein product [Rotaria socialis]CAF3318625.1 unnamed protein product [Rotaria socialis]
MQHTNLSYNHDSEANVPDKHSPNGQIVLSSEPTAQTSNDPKTSSNVNLNNISSITIDKNDVSLDIDEVNIENKPVSSSDNDSYYSLKRLLDKRRGERDEDSKLPRRVKQFYKDQDELIDIYQRLHSHGTEKDTYKKQRDNLKRKSKILTKLSLGVNIILFIIKIVASVISKSLSVVSSVIDSAVDLATSVILFLAWRSIKKRDPYRYPEGRERLEPIAIIILSVIMSAASVLVIYESINRIVNDAQYLTETNTTKTLTDIDMSVTPIAVMAITIVSKAILFALCCRIKLPAMIALTTDHRNDVASNVVALFCGLIATYAYKNKINQKAVVIDPIGAILISIYIIIMWVQQANDQVKHLSGHTADPKFLSQLTWLTYHHSPAILKIDTVRAFYSGTLYLVEVHIVLPKDMILTESHDIGESLQNKIEDLPEVERAFVHVDHDYAHNPTHEHKVV